MPQHGNRPCVRNSFYMLNNAAIITGWISRRKLCGVDSAGDLGIFTVAFFASKQFRKFFGNVAL